jgi:hypothetical protein
VCVCVCVCVCVWMCVYAWNRLWNSVCTCVYVSDRGLFSSVISPSPAIDRDVRVMWVALFLSSSLTSSISYRHKHTQTHTHTFSLSVSPTLTTALLSMIREMAPMAQQLQIAITYCSLLLSTSHIHTNTRARALFPPSPTQLSVSLPFIVPMAIPSTKIYTQRNMHAHTLTHAHTFTHGHTDTHIYTHPYIHTHSHCTEAQLDTHVIVSLEIGVFLLNSIQCVLNIPVGEQCEITIRTVSNY